MTNKDNYCVIMGGGIGSRFWPFSRKTLPKQFLDFFGTGRSLLQQTFDRFQKVIPTENILIVTNAMYADLVKKQLPEVNEKTNTARTSTKKYCSMHSLGLLSHQGTESKCQYSSGPLRPPYFKGR